MRPPRSAAENQHIRRGPGSRVVSFNEAAAFCGGKCEVGHVRRLSGGELQ